MFNESCNHNFVDNVCTKCNLVIEKFFQKSEHADRVIRDVNKYSIIDQLVDIPEEIITIAKRNIIRKQNEIGKKIRNDKKNTFIQIYEAYIESGNKTLNPHVISKQLGLSRKEVNWCLKQISQTSLTPSVHEEVNKHISIVIISPIAYVSQLCIKNNITEYEKNILDMTHYILKEKDILFSSRPEYIACAIIKKFCDTKDIGIRNFSKKNNISDNALKKAIVDIEEFF